MATCSRRPTSWAGSRWAALTAVTAGLIFSGLAQGADVSIHPSGRYYQDSSGKPIFLIGYYAWADIPDSGNGLQYVNQIANGGPYKINYIRVTLGVNNSGAPSYTGHTPFVYSSGKAVLADSATTPNNLQWDTVFWIGLRTICQTAKNNGVIANICLFDGVNLRGCGESYTYCNTFWNPDNQDKSYYPSGNYSDSPGCFYRVNDFNSNAGIGYYQRKFIDKAIAETAGFDNVMFEIGNELGGSDAAWNTAVINYVKARTSKPIVQNGGEIASNKMGLSTHDFPNVAQVKPAVASLVGNGYPAWVDPDNDDWPGAFGLFSCGGSCGTAYAAADTGDRQSAWLAFAGGSACWGGFTEDYWDWPNPHRGFSTTLANYYKNLQDFIAQSGIHFWEMTPQHSLVSNSSVNSCLAKAGSYYMAYVFSDASATINLSAVSGSTIYRLFNPKTGEWTNEQSVAGGGTATFNKPSGAEDWVILVGVSFSFIPQAPYSGTPAAIPGVVQAEQYDVGGQGSAYYDMTSGNSGGEFRSEDVDIQTTSDTGGGYNVGWMDPGEWLEYTVNVAATNYYDIKMRVAAPSSGSFHIEFDGRNITGTQSIGSTGDWQNWTTVTVPSVRLTVGQQVMRVSVDSGGWNFNYVDITAGSPPPATWNTLGSLYNLGNGQSPTVGTDSHGNIHIICGGSTIRYLKYSPSNMNTPLVSETIASPNGSGDWAAPSIQLDSNDVPHVAFTQHWYSLANTVWYTNRIGGSWKAPFVAIPDVGVVVNPRLVLRNGYAYISSMINGPIARVTNLGTSPTTDILRTGLSFWGNLAGDNAGNLYYIGRNGPSGHFLQKYDSGLNTVGGTYEVSMGKPGKTNKASGVYGDKNGIIHMVMDCTTGGPNEMLYNNTSRRNGDGSFQNAIQGLVGTTNGPNGEAPGWWNDDVWEVVMVDALNIVYVAYREWSQAGTGLITKVNASGFTEPTTAFAPTIQRQEHGWNCELAPAQSKGVYVVWEAGGYCYLRGVGVGEADTTAPGSVSNFTATPGNDRLTLSWTNPVDGDFNGTMIRYKTTGWPTGPTDGTFLTDKINVPGSNDGHLHTGLTAGVTYYYRAFTHDAEPNYNTSTAGNTVSGVPFHLNLTTVATDAFNSNAGGWNLSTWRQSTAVFPTMGWVADAGCSGGGIQCVGAGYTDGTGDALREGGEMWKAFSTASINGYTNIQNITVSCDVQVSALGNDYTGISGNGDHGLFEEQLTLFFSTDGGTTWTDAGYLNRAALNGLHTCGTRSFDLSDYPACNNNPNFAVKFRWQLNTGPESPSGADIANIDNVVIKGTVSGGDVTPPGPVASQTATAATGQITLNWTNPSDADFTGTMIRYSTTGYPAGPTNGTLLVDKAGTPGSPDQHVHTGVACGTPYYYALFAHDVAPNYAASRTATANVWCGTNADFDGDGDVDISDFGVLQACLNASDVPAPTGCGPADLNGNGYVDEVDLGLFGACFNGPNRTPACAP